MSKKYEIKPDRDEKGLIEVEPEILRFFEREVNEYNERQLHKEKRMDSYSDRNEE